MKPYKTKKANTKVRTAVNYANAWLIKHPSVGRKYLSNEEFTFDMAKICNVSYNMAKRVTWFVRADGARDAIATKIWGFNQHTA